MEQTITKKYVFYHTNFKLTDELKRKLSTAFSCEFATILYISDNGDFAIEQKKQSEKVLSWYECYIRGFLANY